MLAILPFLALLLLGQLSAQSVLVSAEPPVTASDRAGGDRFGQALAISGDTMVVAVQGDDTAAGNNAGSVRIFIRNSGAWTQQAVLTPSGAAAGDRFGTAVAIEGDTVAIGSTHDDSPTINAGSVTIFTRSGTVWTQQASLTAGDPAQDDHFGISLALSGDTLLVGADGKNTGAGAAYVFLRNGGGAWSQQAKLTGAGLQSYDGFGCSVALSGETVLIGAEGDDSTTANTNEGCAYVFLRTGDAWNQQTQLFASDPQTDAAFGTAVALSGETALIGASGSDGFCGAAYLMARSGTVWNASAKLLATGGQSYDAFGAATAVQGDLAIIGSPRAAAGGNDNVGNGQLFRRVSASWNFQAKIEAAGSATNAECGGAVALSGDTLVLGAAGDDAAAGRAHPFHLVLDPTLAQTWRFTYFAQTTGDGAAADLADPDRDGIVNLLERAFQLHPLQSAMPILAPGSGTMGLPHVALITDTGPARLRIEFIRRKSTSQPGMTWHAQFASTLDASPGGSWTDAAAESVTSLDSQWERVIVEDSPPPDAQRRFARVMVTEP